MDYIQFRKQILQRASAASVKDLRGDYAAPTQHLRNNVGT